MTCATSENRFPRAPAAVAPDSARGLRSPAHLDAIG
jgi:hypothetical protein